MNVPFLESLEHAFFAALSGIVKSFSYRTAGRIGSTLGGVAYSLAKARRTVTLDNLAHAFPEVPPDQQRRIAKAAYRSYGTALCEMLWAGNKSEEELKSVVRKPDQSLVQNLLSCGKGVLVLSAHFGNWEFLAQGFRLHVGKPASMIVQRQRNKRIDAMIDAARRRWDNQTIAMGVSSREVFAALGRGAMVLLLGDQSGPKESVFVNFFGRPAATHRGAAAFSLKTGAPLVMVLMVRQPDGTYEAAIEEINRNGLERYTDENINELTRRHVAVLEKYIRMYPEQWLWMHKRWKHTEYHQSEKLAAEET